MDIAPAEAGPSRREGGPSDTGSRAAQGAPPPRDHGQRSTSRNPTCARCRNHGEHEPVRGHRLRCRYRYCECDRCKLVELRRSVMARQVALRRIQLLESTQRGRGWRRRG